jgi:hypothetical protein
MGVVKSMALRTTVPVVISRAWTHERERGVEPRFDIILIGREFHLGGDLYNGLCTV